MQQRTRAHTAYTAHPRVEEKQLPGAGARATDGMHETRLGTLGDRRAKGASGQKRQIGGMSRQKGATARRKGRKAARAGRKGRKEPGAA